MGWYDGAINGLREARSQEKVFIWMDDGESAYEHESQLRNRLDEHDDDLSELLWRNMEGDPDKFSFNGESCMYFTLENCDDGKQYIIIGSMEQFDGDARAEIERLLTEFYGESREDFFDTMDEQSWEAFNKEEEGFKIAFRGGYGYTYDLWIAKNNKIQEK